MDLNLIVLCGRLRTAEVRKRLDGSRIMVVAVEVNTGERVDLVNAYILAVTDELEARLTASQSDNQRVWISGRVQPTGWNAPEVAVIAQGVEFRVPEEVTL